MTSASGHAAELALDSPLPDELAGRRQGWFTRYRRYPVFSRPWMRGRLRVLVPLVVLGWLGLMLPALLATDPGQPLPLGGAVQLAVGLLLPLWLGPRLALWVRQRQWPPHQEWRALLAAVGSTMLLMLCFHEWGAEPLKQWIAEQHGAVDANGKRKRMVMILGVSVANGDRQAPPKAAADLTADPWARTSNLITLALLSAWLAGAAALPGWRQERQQLAALARERELARAQLRRREAELRLSVLAAQVEPHFLFNTLAGVRSAIATDPARASDMIDRLVDYLRAAIPRLRSDGQVQATLGSQLDIVRAYLGLMAARMPRLHWQVHAAPELLGAAFPPLMLISLAENAVKHGVERKIGPAQVEVRAARGADGRLQVTVQDDGPGFHPTGSGGGLGLANIRERLAELFDGQASLSLKARPEGGVAATVALPLTLPTTSPPPPAPASN